jgi:hypothetical protein
MQLKVLIYNDTIFHVGSSSGRSYETSIKSLDQELVLCADLENWSSFQRKLLLRVQFHEDPVTILVIKMLVNEPKRLFLVHNFKLQLFGVDIRVSNANHLDLFFFFLILFVFIDVIWAKNKIFDTIDINILNFLNLFFRIWWISFRDHFFVNL